MKLITVSQMKAIEKEADDSGLTYDQMMENAGQGLAEVIQDMPIEEEDREVFGLVGAGNNGGDALVALSHLAADGWRTRAYLVKRKNDALVKRLKMLAVKSHRWMMMKNLKALQSLFKPHPLFWMACLAPESNCR